MRTRLLFTKRTAYKVTGVALPQDRELIGKRFHVKAGESTNLIEVDCFKLSERGYFILSVPVVERTDPLMGVKLKMIREDVKLCHCQAYGFPHRLGSGECEERK